MTSTEDDFIGRQPQGKKTNMEDILDVRNLNEDDLMEDHLNGR